MVDEAIKVFELELNIPENGILEFTTTQELNGFIEAIIIGSDKPVNIKICLDGHRDEPIFNVQSYIGNKYLQLRKSAINCENEMFNYAPERWALIDKLYIRVKGAFGELIKIQVRYS